MLSVVPVSHWSFARFKGNGPSDQLLRSEGEETRREEVGPDLTGRRVRVDAGLAELG